MKRLEDVLQAARQTAGPPSPGRPDGSETGSLPAPDGAVCPHCGGAGFVRRAVSLGHPDFGRAVPCVCALQENETERHSRLLRYSNLGAVSRYTFQTLLPRGRGGPAAQQERYERAVRAAQAFAAAPRGWLVLQGASGSGKTHLAAALANAVIAAGRPALFMVVPDLLDHLRTTYAPESELPYDRLFEQVRNAELLVLDDLGAQSTTPWAEEKLYQLVNHRFNEELPTVFTLGLRLDQLDERLRTRLNDGKLSQVHSLDTEEGAAPESADPLDLPLLTGMTFDAFRYHATGPDLTTEDALWLEQAYRQAQGFAAAPEGWLVLEGESGSGKTHLAAAIAHRQREEGRPCLFVVVPDFLDRLRAMTASETGGGALEFFERVRTSPFLILDDLGAHNDTPWAREKLFQLLNHRYNAKLPTVITYRPSDSLESRWTSRLYDTKVSFVIEIRVRSYRSTTTPPPARRGRGTH